MTNLCVVLVATRNPLNIGAAARAMSNFGFPRLRVVNPYEVAFREARSAVGAADLLRSAEEFASVADAVADCQLVVGTTAGTQRELQQPLKTLPEGAALMRKKPGRVALLFGSEKRGLSNEDLSHCHWVVRIATRDEHPSMNLGQAVAVCLYEIARVGAKPTKGPNLAVAGDQERITKLLSEALQASGYLKSRTAENEQKVRRLVRRLELAPDDAHLWMGMLRQIVWKLAPPRPPWREPKQ